MRDLYKRLIPWHYRTRMPALIKSAVLTAPFALLPIAMLGSWV